MGSDSAFGSLGRLAALWIVRTCDANSLAEDFLREWSGLRESNSHLNLGKVSSQLQKTQEMAAFSTFLVLKWKMDGKWKMENAHRSPHKDEDIAYSGMVQNPKKTPNFSPIQ